VLRTILDQARPGDEEDSRASSVRLGDRRILLAHRILRDAKHGRHARWLFARRTDETHICPAAPPIAAGVLVAVLLATACTAGQGLASGTPGSTTPAAATAAPSVARSPARASASPRPTAAGLTWTPRSLEEDWPAPVRAEPGGGVTVVPILRTHEENGRYEDATGDTGSDAFPWVDIRAVAFCHNGACSMVVAPPDVEPAEQWIAYGLVVDDDGDGRADRRVGVDNIPGFAAGLGRHRAWITDLNTGRTISKVRTGDDSPTIADTFLTTSYPVGLAEPPRSKPCEGGGARPPTTDVGLAAAAFGLRGDTTGGNRGADPAFYYAWASVIVDGHVAATDYAPDAGWLHPSTNAPPSAPNGVRPPIDSIEEAVAAVGFVGFQPSDTHVAGASSWFEAEARGDGWDLTFVCGAGTLYARTTFGECPAVGCKPVYATVHVSRDGTVGSRCEWPEGEEAAGCR
jgi:hypothetical protein